MTHRWLAIVVTACTLLAACGSSTEDTGTDEDSTASTTTAPPLASSQQDDSDDEEQTTEAPTDDSDTPSEPIDLEAILTTDDPSQWFGPTAFVLVPPESEPIGGLDLICGVEEQLDINVPPQFTATFITGEIDFLFAVYTMESSADAEAAIAAIGDSPDPCQWDVDLSDNSNDAGFEDGTASASNIQLFDHRGYSAASADGGRSGGGPAPDGFIAVGNVLAHITLVAEGRHDLLPAAFDFIVDQVEAAG